MVNLVAPPAVCSVCGDPLGAEKICVACLLRAGFRDDVSRPEATRFGDFEIESRDDGSLWELGRGAMGITYRAVDTVLNRTVALKVIAAVGASAMRERFLREARAAAGLRHPNIAGVFQFGASSDGDGCYCAMELVEGETLEALVRRNGPLPAEIVLETALQVARALVAAAQRGLVHRDLKPGNIMLGRGEGAQHYEAKVIDFGLAKAVTAAGEMELTHGNFVGTPAFASPEQFAHGLVDARTDIYALGVTMWFALTGRLPFAGTSIEEIRQRQSDGALPLEQLRARAVPRTMVELLRSCLSFDPAQRPASARELIAALETCRAQIARRRRRARGAVIALVCAMAVALAFIFFLSRNQSPTDNAGGEIVTPARPTENGDAYLLYLRGRQIETTNRAAAGFQAAAQLYEQAISLDPGFALARARLSICANELGHASGEPAWKGKARSEAEEAVRLRPQLGEARLALGYLYYFEGDTARAEHEVRRATELLPNSAEVPLLAAYIYKRQNKYRDRIAALERAEALDPQNATVRAFQGLTYRWVRDWPAAMRSLDRRKVVRPNMQLQLQWYRANEEFHLTGDLAAVKNAIAEAERVARDSGWLNAAHYEVAVLERDYDEAEKFLARASDKTAGDAFFEELPAHRKSFHEALLAVARRGGSEAHAALELARSDYAERVVSLNHDKYIEGVWRADLGLVLAFLGHKEEAIHEALRAVKLQAEPPGMIEQNARSSALAMVYAQSGEPEKAIELIEHLLTVPCELRDGAVYNMTLTDLKWRWEWDPLRSHPRFQKLIASPEPVTVY